MREEKEVFEEAYERLKKASSDQTLMEMYRSREKTIRDWNNSIHSAKEEGEKEGIKNSKKKRLTRSYTYAILVSRLEGAGLFFMRKRPIVC